jgi:hypothetical protein
MQFTLHIILELVFAGIIYLISRRIREDKHGNTILKLHWGISALGYVSCLTAFFLQGLFYLRPEHLSKKNTPQEIMWASVFFFVLGVVLIFIQRNHKVIVNLNTVEVYNLLGGKSEFEIQHIQDIIIIPWLNYYRFRLRGGGEAWVSMYLTGIRPEIERIKQKLH